MIEATVKLEALAAVLAVSVDTITRRLARGEIPDPDVREHSRLSWRLSTIQRWNPQAAAKIQRGIDAEIFPYLAAAA